MASPSLSNVDILLTHTWPSLITRYSEKPLSAPAGDEANATSWGIPALHKLYSKAKPKYAFVGDKNVFWEREPFIYPQSSSSDGTSSSAAATRFLSLEQFGNTSKQRQFYAFSVAPYSASSHAEAAQELPANVTPCPFETATSSAKGNNKRSAPVDDFDDGGANSYIFAGASGSSTDGKKRRHGEPPQGYKCKICNVPGHFIQDCPEKVDQPPAANKAANGSAPPDTYVCRLCVSVTCP